MRDNTEEVKKEKMTPTMENHHRERERCTGPRAQGALSLTVATG